MSTYKPTGSQFYVYDFRRGGRRFLGTTGATTKREAAVVESAKKTEAEEQIKKERALRRAPMTVDVAFGRYWQEIGQHAASASDIEYSLDFALAQLGKDTRLDEVTDDHLSKMVAARRACLIESGTLNEKPLYKPVANATVNRTTQIVRRVFVRAAKAWKALIPDPPAWREHFLPEPEERVREFQFDEEDAIAEALRDDYQPLFAFAMVSGLRMKATLLTWPQVDWENRQIRYQKKRRRAGEGVVWRTIPITAQIEAILRPLIGQHETAVFTYVATRTDKRKHLVKGKRYPITFNGLKTRWRRDRPKSGVVDARWHDIRHTTGTRTLRGSKNLRAVQRLLGHERIESTLRYAHVLDQDVVDAIETTAVDVARRRESREMSRGKVVGGEED